MHIAIGADHAGYLLKQELIDYLQQRGMAVRDFGTNSTQSCDYPIYSKKVAHAVANGECELGIVICGSGVGVSLAANKVAGVRCVLCSEAYTAAMARKHNDANVLALGARVIGVDVAKMIVDTWLASSFEGGRHARRVAMIEEDSIGG